jgi:hypothetical protein
VSIQDELASHHELTRTPVATSTYASPRVPQH